MIYCGESFGKQEYLAWSKAEGAHSNLYLSIFDKQKFITFVKLLALEQGHTVSVKSINDHHLELSLVGMKEKPA